MNWEPGEIKIIEKYRPIIEKDPDDFLYLALNEDLPEDFNSTIKIVFGLCLLLKRKIYIKQIPSTYGGDNPELEVYIDVRGERLLLVQIVIDNYEEDTYLSWYLYDDLVENFNIGVVEAEGIRKLTEEI